MSPAEEKFGFLDILSQVIAPTLGRYTFKIVSTKSRRGWLTYRLFSPTIYLSSSWSKKRLFLEGLYRVALNCSPIATILSLGLNWRAGSAVRTAEVISVMRLLGTRWANRYIQLFTEELKRWNPQTTSDMAWKVFISLALENYMGILDKGTWKQLLEKFKKISKLAPKQRVEGYTLLYFYILTLLNKKQNKQRVDEDPMDFRKMFFAQKVMVEARDKDIRRHENDISELRNLEFDIRGSKIQDAERRIKERLERLGKEAEKAEQEAEQKGGGRERFEEEKEESGSKDNQQEEEGEGEVPGGKLPALGTDIILDFEPPLYRRDALLLSKARGVRLVTGEKEDIWISEPELRVEESIVEALKQGLVLNGIPLIAPTVSIASGEDKVALLALIDTSGSMSKKINTVKAMLLATLRARGLKEIAMIGFGERAFWVIKPTQDVIRAVARVRGLYSKGGTNLAPALRLLQRYPELVSKGEIVIISDGYVHDMDEALIELKKLNCMGLRRVYLYLCENERFIELLRRAGIEVVNIEF